MPTYIFKNHLTGKTEEHTMKMADLDTFKNKNKHMTIAVADAFVGDPVAMGRKKVDPEFKEVLRNIGSRTPGGQGLKEYIDSAY